MTVRERLEAMSIRPETHAGLWLDRYVRNLGTSGAAGTHLKSALEALRVPPSYPAFFRRWKESLPAETLTARAVAKGRQAVGLGGESVLETAIALHRTYGVPYLPGSALKGLASRAARKRTKEGDSWHPGGDAFRIVFGVLEDAGFVTFHDALWEPEGAQLPVALDVMTVHHGDYYQGKELPPADWDDPNPVGFLSAHGSYRIALSGPREWAEAAMDFLVIGLKEDGIGAKTAAGYGRMEVDWVPKRIRLLAKPRPANKGSKRAGRQEAAPIHIPWEPRVKAIFPGNAEQEVPRLLADYQGVERHAAARKVVENLGKKYLRDPKRSEKEWVKKLLEAAGGTP